MSWILPGFHVKGQGSNPACCLFLQIKFYCNTAMPIYFHMLMATFAVPVQLDKWDGGLCGPQYLKYLLLRIRCYLCQYANVPGELAYKLQMFFSPARPVQTAPIMQAQLVLPAPSSLPYKLVKQLSRIFLNREYSLPEDIGEAPPTVHPGVTGPIMLLHGTRTVGGGELL